MERRESVSAKFPLGSELPKFRLHNVDNSYIDSSALKFSRGLLVVFTCNHCPYVQGSEKMLMNLARRFEPMGIKTITINSNDPIKYPDDSFQKMKEKAQQLHLPYAYLFDDTQEVARKFDAACTPECYLFDSERKLVYHGAINDNHREPSAVKSKYLESALEQLASGDRPDPAFVHPFGCSIKWK